MPAPLFRRVEGHIYLKLNLQDIIKWGSRPREDGSGKLKIHPIVIAYLSALARGEKGKTILYTEYDSEEPPKYAIDPRAWEQVSNIIYDNNGVIVRELLVNKLGNSVTNSFITFIQKSYISINDILNGDVKTNKIPKTLDGKITLSLSLLSANEDNVGIVRQFIKQNLGDEILANYDLLWASDDNDRLIFLKSLQDKEIELKPLKEENNKKNNEQKNTYDDIFDLV